MLRSPVFVLFTVFAGAIALPACSSPPGNEQIDLLRFKDWKFAYLGRSLNYPPENREFHPIRLPGRWHERLPGTPRTGVAYFRLDFELKPRDTERLLLLILGPVESAAEVRLNGEIIGGVGKPGTNRASEFARIHPEFLELRPGLLKEKNRLELIISNFHTRGGALLRLRLSQRARAHGDFARRMLREAWILGMLCVSGFFFFIIWLTNRRDRSYLFASILMLLIIVRGVSSNALLEFLRPERDWTDLRLLLETWSGVSMTPAILFWFIHHLFPILRERPRPWSRRRDLLRIYFVLFSGVYLNLVAAGLSLWFLIIFDASVYVAHLEFMLRLFIVPSLFLYLALLILAVAYRQPGAVVILVGFLVFMAAAMADVATIINASGGPLRASAGMLIFVLCVGIVLARRIHGLHKQVLRGRNYLSESNRRLRSMGRGKDRFLLNSTRVLVRPLNEMVETILRLLDKPGPGMGTAQLQLLTRLADGGRESLRRFARMEDYLTRLHGGHGSGTAIALGEFLGREIIALEKARNISIEFQAPPHLPPVLAHGDSLRLLLMELCEIAARRDASCLVTPRDSGDACLLRLRLCYKGEAENEEEAKPDPSFGLPLLERIAEIHGGHLRTDRGETKEHAWIQWTFRLEYADRPLHGDPDMAERIRHARFLSAAGFLGQSSREFEELRKEGALDRKQADDGLPG